MYQVSLGRACKLVDLSRSVYYYQSRRDDHVVIDKLQTMTDKRPRDGFWKMYYRTRKEGLVWHHKRIHRVYKFLKLNINLGMENKIGSIEAGKLADFTVLEQDPFTVEPMKIRDIPVWGTILGGRPQNSKDIVPEPSLFYRDYDKYMSNLTLTPEEKKSLTTMTKVTLNDLPNYYEDAYTTHGIFEMNRSKRNMEPLAKIK